MPKINKKGGMVNRTAVGTYKGKLIERHSGAYGEGGAGKGERAGAKPILVNGYERKGKRNKIECDGSVVLIDTLKPDPLNARLHPERNLAAIMESLDSFGQRKPIVVNKRTMIVVAGNGTMEAALALGWTKIAASIRPMTDAEAMAYGLADNQTALLAKWDFEVVAKLEKLITEQGLSMAGWSQDELEVLRAADWTPPVISDDEYEQSSSSVEHECPECGHKWSS